MRNIALKLMYNGTAYHGWQMQRTEASVQETLQRQIDYNWAIAEEGLRGDYGANIGRILLQSYGMSIHNRAKAYAAAGSDARMNGCDLPVVINSGSGNQGLTASLPVIVYAKELGSAAAPTAGLHFTPELMDTIRSKGVGIAEVTLHVGLGTFRPVQEDEITDHKMHSEWYSISEETAQRIRETKAAGHRVIAVGTTSCRTLEAAAAKYGEIKACSGNTSIFLYPGVKFNCIDGLVTNFHLPESTLIMLIAALYGYDKTMHAYKVAVEEKYRFFSFGDAMLIL